LKLHISPNYKQMPSGGVASVLEAHHRHLKKMGVTFTKNEDAADLVIVHAIGQTERRLDVYHSHGVYPTSLKGWFPQAAQVNAELFKLAMTARRVVAVSDLAADFYRRDFHISPTVIRNGVDFDQLPASGGDVHGPILWPKMTANPVCDPRPLLWLARNRTDLKLASLIPIGENIHNYGKLPRKEFYKFLAKTSIYLATTLENNSMATMEAMALGVPVVGFDWGFNREWLQNGTGCVLVEPGDMDGLSRAITNVLLHHWAYSSWARDYARTMFSWDTPIQQTYDLYAGLMKNPAPRSKISVVVPLHNYARYIGETLKSIFKQTVPVDEIIVVDDASTDNPSIPDGVRYIRLDVNQGVARARNIGIETATGDIILCVDADDVLAKDYVQRGLPKFADPLVGIVFGPLGLCDENLNPIGKRWFNDSFNFKEQALGRNRVPTNCIFRKSAWERAGGFRKYESPAEDAGLWMRIASQGWKVEFLTDNKVTMFYRMHPGSLSSGHKFPDWFGGREWKNRNAGLGRPVQIYTAPKVSFIGEYRINHEWEFIRTMDSIEGLKATGWEVCISGTPTPRIKAGWPFVRWNAEPSTKTHVMLEMGDVLDEEMWSRIVANMEFPA